MRVVQQWMATFSGAFLGLLSLLPGPGVANAQVVTERLPSGIAASAQFLRGEPDKKAVLVLHGFMTTRHFNTVQSLVSEISGQGYTVLAPTLSLGVDNRKASIPCNALHTHTWDDDIAEIDFWVRWLVGKGYGEVVLVGHSTGSLHLVSYAGGPHARAVSKVVATSLVNFRRYTDPAIVSREMAAAQRRARSEKPALGQYHLAFCEDYTSTPASYLSYIGWTRERVLQTLQSMDVPVDVIMGGADRRFSSDWIDALRETGTRVFVIEGASHFFDAIHEFDLLEQVMQCLEEGA